MLLSYSVLGCSNKVHGSSVLKPVPYSARAVKGSEMRLQARLEEDSVGLLIGRSSRGRVCEARGMPSVSTELECRPPPAQPGRVLCSPGWPQEAGLLQEPRGVRRGDPSRISPLPARQ